MLSSPDTIPVRPGEQFDEARLSEYLQDKLPGSHHPLHVRQFGGGAANLTYLLDFEGHAYVLRRPPPGPLARSAHDMGREFNVLSALHPVFPLAPRPLLSCEDPAIIGTPFFIMALRHGVVVRKTLPPAFEAAPEAPRLMSEALIDALATLHAVDYGAAGLADLGKPKGFLGRQIEGWWARWERARAEDLPEMTEVYSWLQRNRPLSGPAGLVHNDFKLDNVMLAHDDPGKLIAVLDWDMCTLGDPLCDLGNLLTYWIQPDDPPYLQQTAMMPIDARFPRREALIERYAEKSGLDLSDLSFYHALGLYRLTVIMAQLHVRFRRGQTRDPRFAALETLIPLTALAALQVADA